MKQAYNFNAGPCVLPKQAIESTVKALYDFDNTGIGIAEGDRERIFTQFTKVNNFTEGVGLGLSLSQQTAKLLGGQLALDTSYLEGSRFILKIKKEG